MSKFDKQAEARQSAIHSIIRDTQELRESIADGDMVNAKLCMDSIKLRKGHFEAAIGKDPERAAADQIAFDAAWSDYLAAAEPILAEVRAAKEREANAATDKQMDYLGILGYSGRKDLTKQEASDLIDTMKGGRHYITAEDNDDPEAFDSVRRAMRM